MRVRSLWVVSLISSIEGISGEGDETYRFPARCSSCMEPVATHDLKTC
jgi:hypothetical protein